MSLSELKPLHHYFSFLRCLHELETSLSLLNLNNFQTLGGLRLLESLALNFMADDEPDGVKGFNGIVDSSDIMFPQLGHLSPKGYSFKQSVNDILDLLSLVQKLISLDILMWLNKDNRWITNAFCPLLENLPCLTKLYSSFNERRVTTGTRLHWISDPAKLGPFISKSSFCLEMV
jgi:hypothetical protein